MNKKIIFSLLLFTIILSSISVVSAQTKSNTCKDGMMYDSNTDSCILDTYKHIRDSVIPNWLKQTAVWWGQGMVTDDEFLNAIQYLIDEKLLQIPSDKTQDSTAVVSENPFELKVINCSDYGKDSVKVEYSVTNNSGQLVDIELVIKGVDVNGNVLSISTPLMLDLISGQTKYDHTFIDSYPNLDSCGIGINGILK